MIEVVFCDSECGSMKVAKNYKKPDFNKSAIAWIGKKPSKEDFDIMHDGKSVGGNSSEVICLPFILDIGDINIPIDSDYRKKLIFDMYTTNGINDKDTITQLEDSWERYLNEIERLKNYASLGEQFRIWYSDAPYSVCGYYYTCSLLSAYNCKISVIKLPQYIQLSNNSIQSFVSWGEIDAGKFYNFLSLEKELSTMEKTRLTSMWRDLRKEQSTLRAVVNGSVIGVPEDFYDHIIRKEIPDGAFIMAQLIGNVLGNHPLGVGDWWYAKRITKMIEQGELVVLQKQKITYRQLLKKA